MLPKNAADIKRIANVKVIVDANLALSHLTDRKWQLNQDEEST